MAPTAEIDALFDVRNYYYLGAYQQCINECQNSKLKSADDVLVKDTFLYRSYIALNKPSVALNEIDVFSAAVELKAIRRLAEYLSTNAADKKKRIVEEITSELETGTRGGTSDIVLLMNSVIFTHENNVNDALRTLSKAESLECHAAIVQSLLKIDRVDLAIKEIKKMQETDEDSTITQLALAWVNMSAGKERLKDAFYIYQEMIDKYGATSMLLVSQASCLVLQQKYEEAEKLLQDAQQRDVNNAEVLIGLIVVGQFLGKSLEVTNRYVNQLKQDYPNHVWTRDFLAKEKAFDRLVEEKC